MIGMGSTHSRSSAARKVAEQEGRNPGIHERVLPARGSARARQPAAQPIAFTFIDYDQDWDGVAESLTWSQLYRRSSTLLISSRFCGSTGDRAVILAPQGLDYIVAFLGAIAGRAHRGSAFGSDGRRNR